MRPTNTLKDILVYSKDKKDINQTSNVFCRICPAKARLNHKILYAGRIFGLLDLKTTTVGLKIASLLVDH